MKYHTVFMHRGLLHKLIRNAFRAGAKLGEVGWYVGEFEVREDQAVKNAERTIRRHERKQGEWYSG